MLLNLFCTQPAFVLSAVEHKVVTDKAASLIKAAYLVQNEQRVEYALQARESSLADGRAALYGGLLSVSQHAAHRSREPRLSLPLSLCLAVRPPQLASDIRTSLKQSSGFSWG